MLFLEIFPSPLILKNFLPSIDGDGKIFFTFIAFHILFS